MKLSVVIATHNRTNLLLQVLACLVDQSLPAHEFEVVVVDDGSEIPVRSVVQAPAYPFSLTILEQRNAGAAAARHYGILAAKGDVVVVVDDDMLAVPELLEAHLEKHAAGATLVLGHIVDPLRAASPLFHRFHSQVIAKCSRRFRTGTVPRGVHVCTGNVSFRRTDYLAVGGFDLTLARSEDRELGVRLEKAGARLAFAEQARTLNLSDHTSKDVWFARNFAYGVHDLRISRKHPDIDVADPFHYFDLVSSPARPLLALSIVAPSLAKYVARAAFTIAEGFDRIGIERAAIAGATLSYGMEYFRGVRSEAGSLKNTAQQAERWFRRRWSAA